MFSCAYQLNAHETPLIITAGRRRGKLVLQLRETLRPAATSTKKEARLPDAEGGLKDHKEFLNAYY